MAYGLQITNPSSHIVVDSEYEGVYYLGKNTFAPTGTCATGTPGGVTGITKTACLALNSTNGFSLQQTTNEWVIPGYDSSDVPPLIFFKPFTSDVGAAGRIEDYISISSLQKVTPAGGVGGLSAGSIATGANIVYCNRDSATWTESSRCTSAGGVFFSGNSGTPLACRRTSNGEVPTYQRRTSTSGLTGVIDLTFNTSGNVTGFNIIEAGTGWGVGTTGAFDQHPSGSENVNKQGFGPYNTGTSSFDEAQVARVTATSLATGWVLATKSVGDFTAYAFGVGGDRNAPVDFGLELRNTAGDVTFSSNSPPPSIRGIQNVSISNATLAGGQTGTVTGSYPLASTAFHALSPFPRCVNNVSAALTAFDGVDCSVRGQVTEGIYGLRYTTSGTTITGISIGVESIPGSLVGSTFSGSVPDQPGNAGLCVQRSGFTAGNLNSAVPSWDQTGTPITTNTGAVATVQGRTFNVASPVMFLNTTVFDGLSY